MFIESKFKWMYFLVFLFYESMVTVKFDNDFLYHIQNRRNTLKIMCYN